MTRLLLAITVALATAPGRAQLSRRGLPAGDITGLEMTLEGPQDVLPGETARWFVTVHEIVRDRDFRPAAGVALRALASYEPTRAVAEATTDEYGRATLELAVPADREEGFEVVFEARSSRRRLQRRFRLQVERARGAELTLHLTRPSPEPREVVGLFGELLDVRGRPVAGAEVELSAVGPTGIAWGPTRTRTDRFGFYATTARFPEGVGPLRLRARAATAEVETPLLVRPRDRSTLRLTAAPRRTSVAPASAIPVDVAVRDRLGRPLAGALVTAEAGERGLRARTDAQGRATLPWVAPSTTPGDGRAWLRIRAVAPGVGRAETTAHVRVSDHRHHAAAVPEGNALIVGAPSRLYVRVVDAGGVPAADLPVAVSGPRLGEASGRTDADGVAMLEVRLDSEDGAPDACGGATAVAATLTLGDERREVCVPADPDATVRVRARVDEPGQVSVTLHPRRDVTRAPILVTVLRRERERVIPLGQRVLDAGTTQASITAPTEGRLLVRARPLVGPALAEVRGGIAALDLSAPPPLHLDGSGASPEVRGDGRVLLVALPPGDAPGHARADASVGGPLLAAARLAEDTPTDDAAPAVLRDGSVVSVPAPEGPLGRGLLRDPWRQRARYRTGRLALVLRAIERYVAEAPELEEVAERRGAGHRFNRAILDALAGHPDLGAEGARDLGGAPLGIEALEALDPAFTFDRVARRVTRARLMGTLLRLRELVRERGLDHEFARRSSPDEWLAALRENFDEAELIDAWRRPLQVRPTPRGARPFLEVVPGWSLVSAGPDGRFGTHDDVVDPTARVLPSGSLYAQAVDEDGLLRRLTGVALGQATLDELAEVMTLPEAAPALTPRPPLGLASLPTPPAVAHDLDLPEAEASAVIVLDDPAGRAQLPLPPTPARYALVAHAAGRTRRALWRHPGEVALVAPWPERLGLDETVTLRPVLLGFGDVEGIQAHVEAEGVEATLRRTIGSVRRGDAIPLALTLKGRREGVARVALELRDAAGRSVWAQELRPRVLDGDAGRATWAGAAVEGAWDVRVALPPGSRDASGELVLVAPGGLAQDPLVRRWGRRGAPLRAWAQVMAGQRPDPATVSASREASGLPASLGHACAVTVWAAVADDYGPDWQRHFEGARSRLLHEEVTDAREIAASFAALAPIAGGPPMAAGPEPLAARVEAFRERLWEVLDREPNQPTVWARAAAALLLADADDASGRAILRAAVGKVEDAPHGGTWVPHDDPREALAATAALLLAAQLVGAEELVPKLRAALAHRAWLVLAEPSEAAFWLLAASSEGGFGAGTPRAWVDGRAVRFEGGVARFPVAVDGGRVRLRVTAEGEAVPLARIRIDHRRAVAAVEGPMTVEVRGDAGSVASGAAFELDVAATTELIDPVLLVQLPPPALVDQALRGRIAGDDDVVAVEPPDARGVLRLRLRPLAAGARVRVPLPLGWAGSGTTHGLSVAGFDAHRPWHTTSAPPRAVTVQPDG